MIKLDDIFCDLTPGSFLIYETNGDWNSEDKKYHTIEKIKAGTVVAVDIWDMAMAVGLVDLCKFECYSLRNNSPLPEIEWINNWSETHYIVGFWKSFPTLTEIKQAIRKYRKK